MIEACQIHGADALGNDDEERDADKEAGTVQADDANTLGLGGNAGGGKSAQEASQEHAQCQQEELKSFVHVLSLCTMWMVYSFPYYSYYIPRGSKRLPALSV